MLIFSYMSDFYTCSTKSIKYFLKEINRPSKIAMMQYNKKVNTNFNLDDQFYAYYRDIVWNVKKKQIDILLVVSVFLRGGI
ncbi:hypothetical protein D3C80_1568940 [compost metagenome]